MKSVQRGIVVVALASLLAASRVSAQKSSVPPSSRTASGIDLLVVNVAKNPIPNAKVVITDATGEKLANGLTNRLGKFYISRVPPGAYRLTVQLAGFKEYAGSVVIPDHLIAEVNLTLQAMVPLAPGPEVALDFLRHGESALDVVVMDENSAVIPNAGVSITQEETSARLEGKTDQAGRFHASELAPGGYLITVKQLGFKTTQSSVSLSQHGTTSLVVTMVVGSPIVYRDPPSPPMLVETLPSTLDSEVLPEPSATPLPSGSSPAPDHAQKSKSKALVRFFSALGHKLGF
jgi:hypothetical protein